MPPPFPILSLLGASDADTGAKESRILAPQLSPWDARPSMSLVRPLPQRLPQIKNNKAAWRRLVVSNSYTRKIWSGRRGSNPRPRPWQGRALPLSYTRIRDDGDRSPATAELCQMRPTNATASTRSVSGQIADFLKNRHESVPNHLGPEYWRPKADLEVRRPRCRGAIRAIFRVSPAASRSVVAFAGVAIEGRPPFDHRRPRA
jgi:hypothetical protein